MAEISYVAPDEIEDADLREALEAAIKKGRPGPENQSIRAHAPDVMRAFTQTRKMLFDREKEVGFVEHDLKELVRTYIAYSLDCDY